MRAAKPELARSSRNPIPVNCNLSHRIIYLALAVVSAAIPSSAQKLEIDLVVENLIRDRLASGEVVHNEREPQIRRLLEDVGCVVEEQPIDKKSANVICTLAGETKSTIVIGGHFDFVERGRGMVDDWSGTSMLPSLYQALKGRPRKHTYVFVAFAGEERGLVGSKRFVKNLTTDQKLVIRAFVNLECLGLTPTKIWLSLGIKGSR